MKWWEYLLIAIGVVLLFGLFVPMVSTEPSSRSSDKSASRVQYSNYVNAIQLFRHEYGDYPDLFDEDGVLNLGEPENAKHFIETISGRALDGERRAVNGNTQAIAFYSFSERELKWDKQTGGVRIAYYTGNTNIILRIDNDGDGMITVPDGDSTKQVRAPMTAYSLDESGTVAIQMWD